jgi:mRNA deadenylase 3'-5' endonuclease subunit Ccr4
MAMAHRHIQNRIDAATDARDRFNDSLLHKVSFRVGDEVYVYQLPRSDGKQDLTHKLISPYKGPYVVIKALNDVTYQVQEIATRKKKTVHVTRMKKKHNRPTHLLPPEAEQQIPILEGALDERNQEQGDQFQSHATRRQIQRQERENKIQQQSQHFMEEQEQRRQEEQERKYESQEQGHQEQPTQQEPREQQQEHMEQAQGHDEDNELEEGEVVLPPYH